MKHNLNFLLSDKYELLSTLGSGSFGTTYLVRHHLLECLRVIKVIPKDHIRSSSILSEAKLLLSMHHPGIPTIYEVEEDSSFYYLIEEYREGLSLDAYLLSQRHISLDTFYRFSKQLCEIFCYLHTFAEDPVLYMDLKPEHIIVHNESLTLIDFNVAITLSHAGDLCNLYGNMDFSAPEISNGAKAHLNWDIFSIGKICLFMSQYLSMPLPKPSHTIIHKACALNPADRYETVDLLLDALKQQHNNLSQESSCTTIAVVGSDIGCGVTHIAISLVSALNHMGYSAKYYETAKRTLLHTLKDTPLGLKEQNGCYYYKSFQGYPYYGPGVELSEAPSIAVYDCGNLFTNTDERIQTSDFVLMVLNCGLLKRFSSLRKGKNLLSTCQNGYFICNMGHKKDVRFFAHNLHRPVYAYPLQPDPFLVTKEILLLVSNLLQLQRRDSVFSHIKNLFSPKRL